jgi:hypothetical protein
MSQLPRRVTIAVALLLTISCGKSGGTSTGGGGSGAGLDGIALPQEISALPPKAAGSSALHAGSFLRLGSALVASSLPAGSDYATAKTVKWVNERALSRFDILNSIFKAVGQTHYADAENVGAGPYAAIVTAVGDGEEAQTKSLQTWVLSSSMTRDASGRDVNVVHVWLEEKERTIPVELKIRSAPTQNPDGSYADYGVWSIVADLSPDGSQYFVASAEIGPDGASIVKVHETEGGVGSGSLETRGILHKSGSSGYGKVSFPDWSACHGDPCTDLPTVAVAYTYDAHHVKLEIASGGTTTVVAKDRDAVVDLVNRYGLYDAEGNDVSKTRRFGFPFRYGAGGSSYGYYGAWQGRHQLWANGASLPAGTTVTRADRDPSAAAESYTASPVYRGILVKRTYASAQLADIKDVVVNAWDFQNFMLKGDGTAWHRCTMPPPPPPGQPGQPADCESAAFAGFASLVVDPAAGGNVNLDSWGGMPATRTELVVASGQDGLAVKGSNAPFPPTLDTWVNVNVGGPIWIAYDGTGWKKKQVTSIDPTTHQPTFGAGSTAYAIPDGREFYLNDMGVNYVVQCSGGACTAKLELQSVANPANVGSFVAPGTTFSQQAWGQTPSTFRFVTDAADPDFMKLVYATVGTQDQLAGARIGDPVTSQQWGLTATVGGAAVQFNWEYPDGGTCMNCGVQQFLLDTHGQLVQLDDPIRLAPIELVNGAGERRTYSLQFDGSWVSGLPDLHGDLDRGGGSLSPAVAAKAVSIPSGTVVADALDGTKQYVFKQLQVSQYLATVADPGGLDLAMAGGLDLSTVPSWTPTGIGRKPDSATLRYSEGRPVK